MIVKYPELFPKSIVEGYTLHDDRFSSKLDEIRLRGICRKTEDENGKEQVFTIAPSGVMPYFVGLTDEIEKSLFLRRFDVPFWALSYVFGRDDQFWYRLENHFGRYNLVQTVVKDPQKLPQRLLADEKITRLNGEEVVVYKPETVNTDGWGCYHAVDAASFRVQANQLLTWAENNTASYTLEAVQKLYTKVDRFVLAYDHPLARFFHGHWASAERSIRAWTLLHDFGPYCPRTRAKLEYSSPTHKLNGFVYHDNWLHNLMISASMSGIRP